MSRAITRGAVYLYILREESLYLKGTKSEVPVTSPQARQPPAHKTAQPAQETGATN